MSLFRTPRVVQTRAQKKMEQMANEEGIGNEVKSELLPNKDAVQDEKKSTFRYRCVPTC